jgi:Fur family transcriptional regulator, ferric uptake regulator
LEAPAPSSLPEQRTVDGILAVLRRRGLRASASRRIIIGKLVDASSPLAAREIAFGRGGESLGLDLASVYRNLELLERHGIVHRIRTGRGPGLYALAWTEGEYLACEGCGATIEVAPGQLDGLREQVREEFGFEVTFRDVPMVGRCPACTAGEGR